MNEQEKKKYIKDKPIYRYILIIRGKGLTRYGEQSNKTEILETRIFNTIEKCLKYLDELQENNLFNRVYKIENAEILKGNLKQECFIEFE